MPDFKPRKVMLKFKTGTGYLTNGMENALHAFGFHYYSRSVPGEWVIYQKTLAPTISADDAAKAILETLRDQKKEDAAAEEEYVDAVEDFDGNFNFAPEIHPDIQARLERALDKIVDQYLDPYAHHAAIRTQCMQYADSLTDAKERDWVICWIAETIDKEEFYGEAPWSNRACLGSC